MKNAAFLILLCLLALACGNGQQRKLVESAPLISVTYTDGTGREMTLPHPPKRIISIAPNITEMIFALGAQDKLAACSQACDYPFEAQDFPKVTTYPELDREQIKALKADLLVTTDEIFSPRDIQLLEELGTPVFLQSYNSVEDIYQNFTQLGNLLQKESEAAHWVDSLTALENRIVTATREEIHYRTLILVSGDPLKVVGGSGYLNELIEKAGGLNVFGENSEPYPDVTVEAILASQPEFLILPSVDERVYADLISQYPALIHTAADKNHQVFIVDPDLIYRPGPRTLEGLLKLTHILHTPLSPSQFLEP